MQYPVFISVSETARIFGMGRTAVFQRIKTGDFTTAKIGRSTRITFSSAIQFALRSLKEGNGRGVLSEIFGDVADMESWVVAEQFARQLCYTHREPTEVLGINASTIQSPASDAVEAGSPEKNVGGEI